MEKICHEIWIMRRNVHGNTLQCTNTRYFLIVCLGRLPLDSASIGNHFSAFYSKCVIVGRNFIHFLLFFNFFTISYLFHLKQQKLNVKSLTNVNIMIFPPTIRQSKVIWSKSDEQWLWRHTNWIERHFHIELQLRE